MDLPFELPMISLEQHGSVSILVLAGAIARPNKVEIHHWLLDAGFAFRLALALLANAERQAFRGLRIKYGTEVI
jgi:hypothetical protein